MEYSLRLIKMRDLSIIFRLIFILGVRLICSFKHFSPFAISCCFFSAIVLAKFGFTHFQKKKLMKWNKSVGVKTSAHIPFHNTRKTLIVFPN